MAIVLLTGSSGFIGRQVLNNLISKGHHVHCINRKRGQFIHPQVTYYEVDLLQVSTTTLSQYLKQINANLCIHCAWYTNHKDYLIAKINKDWVRASKKLADVFYQTGGKRFIGLGTCIEYQPEDGKYCKEDKTKIGPQTLYAQCKVEFFNHLKSFDYDSNQSYAWARIFFVYGPNDRKGRLIPYIFNQLKMGKQAIPRYGGLRRDYIYIDDLAEQIVQIAKSNAIGAINTGTGQGLTIQSIFNTIGSLLQKSDLIKNNSILHPEEPSLISADMTLYTTHIGAINCRSFDRGAKETLLSFQKSKI